MIDVGQIVEVLLEADRAIFLRVQLRHHGVEALARWQPLYHGPGFGSWWVPEVGLDVLCAFPGLGPDGRADDIDEGYAFGVLSTTVEPPVNGLVAGLSATRRVFKGRPGEAQDDHLQGAHDITIDGPQAQRLKSTRNTVVDGAETRHFKQTRNLTVDGPETERFKATRSLTVDGAETRHFKATRTLTVDGDETRSYKADLTIDVDGDMGIDVDGDGTWTLHGTSSLLGDVEIRIAAPLVKLGATDAVKKIVHETFVALFNDHRHSGVDTGSGTSGPPTGAYQMQIGVHTSTKARVDG